MAAVTVVAADVKPLPGALCRRFDASATVNAGMAVYVDSSGDIAGADSTTFAHAISVGIAVADNDGSTIFLSGDPVDVCVHGPLAGFSGMAEGSFAYVSSTTVGGLVDASPGSAMYRWIVGQSHSATVVFINPFTDNLSQLTG